MAHRGRYDVAVIDMPMPSFFDDAACKTADVSVFFPDRYDIATEEAAKAICHGCPIILRCRAWALDTRQQHGIWGGLTPGERKRVRRHGR